MYGDDSVVLSEAETDVTQDLSLSETSGCKVEVQLLSFSR